MRGEDPECGLDTPRSGIFADPAPVHGGFVFRYFDRRENRFGRRASGTGR